MSQHHRMHLGTFMQHNQLKTDLADLFLVRLQPSTRLVNRRKKLLLALTQPRRQLHKIIRHQRRRRRRQSRVGHFHKIPILQHFTGALSNITSTNTFLGSGL